MNTRCKCRGRLQLAKEGYPFILNGRITKKRLEFLRFLFNPPHSLPQMSGYFLNVFNPHSSHSLNSSASGVYDFVLVRAFSSVPIMAYCGCATALKFSD